MKNPVRRWIINYRQFDSFWPAKNQMELADGPTLHVRW